MVVNKKVNKNEKFLIINQGVSITDHRKGPLNVKSFPRSFSFFTKSTFVFLNTTNTLSITSLIKITIEIKFEEVYYTYIYD